MATLYDEVRSALAGSRFKPKKKLGQNFLVHEHVIESILRLLALSTTDEIVEIGPGLGFLTRRLADRVSQVWAIEVDRFLVERLTQSPLGKHPHVKLIHDDILNVHMDELLPERKVKLVANLPYSISTEVLFKIFDWRDHFSSLVLMMQKEVAERIAAQPGTKSYGTLSVWSQLNGEITEKVQVSPEAFFPRPEVRSTILRIELFREPLVSKQELPWLRTVIRAAFGQRRKTLANTLAGSLNQPRELIVELLRTEGIDPGRRGETLGVDCFIALARAMERCGILAAGK